MTYATQFTALADPTRRAIFEALAETPATVGTLASRLPVSRPAVSQHLAVLKAAGLVAMQSRGAAHLYHLEPDGLGQLRAYLDRFWGDAMSAFEDYVRQQEEPAMPAPVVKSLRVPVTPDRAFDIFARETARWWPLDKHSMSGMSGETSRLVAIEPCFGGAITETLHDGTKAHWGHVTDWAPGLRLGIAWHVGQHEAMATTITVTFVEDQGGTLVTLSHLGWEVLGARATATRQNYDTGWDHVVGTCFSKAASG